METIIIKIEKGNDQYGAWIEGIPGIYGAGDTVQEVKDNILEAIKLYEQYNEEMPKRLDGNYDIKWEFDTTSFLEYISVVFTKSGLERITGINQKQLSHYSTGLKKPRKEQIEKIDVGIHRFVDELRQIHLV
jgi:predicted RNase H-like HicB family nuclease